MSLLTELKRRKVFRVAGAYLVVGWLLIQVAATVLPQFDVPAWAPRMVTLLVALGFPIALVMAWALDVTPEGVRVDTNSKGSKPLIAVAVALVVLALGWYFRGHVEHPKTTPAAVAAAPTTPVANVAPQKSIAVLAFTDLSPEHNQEYFSDGMAEEILNALAQVKDMKVAGRTSSFFYKGRNEDLRTIGKALDVANVLEGSVRKQGDKVRITAQLIRSEDGFHLWSESYDGDLKDVFALQEKIARAITDQLQVVLQGDQKTRLIPVSTSNPEAYSLYLQATSIFDRRDAPHFADAVASLQQAIALDPKYARAHSRLATIYTAMGSYIQVDPGKNNAMAIAEANAALALDPTLAEPHAALGLTYGKQPGGYLRQREEFERAIALDPDDVISNFWYGLSLVMSGYRAAGIARFDHALAVDPMMPNVVRWRGIMYAFDGDNVRAEQFLDRARSFGLPIADRELADIAFQHGDREAAIRKWADGTRYLLQGLPPGSPETLSAGVFGDAAARERALSLLNDYLAKPRPQLTQVTGMVPLALARLGQPSRALALELDSPIGDSSDFFAYMWSPKGKAMRALPEFPAFLRKMGLYALWDQYGPPDLCRKTDKGEYVCQ
jgi:TolB-like protein/Tfp pilus assembly protein PilF